MKRVLAIFLILISVISFFITYLLKDKEERERMENVEKDIAREFRIPDDPELADPEEIYPLMAKVARESGVNLFRTSIYYNEKDQVEIQKYLLLNVETRFFDTFYLKIGRVFTAEETQHGDQFLSTVETGESNQIGTLADFAGNDRIWIRPLKAAYTHLSVGGIYFVETIEEKEFDAFIELLVKKVNARYPEISPGPYSDKDFKVLDHSSFGGLMGSPLDKLNYIAFVIIVVIILLLVVYYMFHEAKRIGIMKMHGLSSFRIWFLLIGRLLGVVFAFSVMLAIFAGTMIRDATPQFFVDVSISLLKTYLIAAAGSLIAYFYISNVKVSDTLKNRRDTGGIFALNTLLKAGCSILLILGGLSIWTNYIEIRARQEEAKYWEQSKDYGVFYPVYVGYDLEDIKRGSDRKMEAKATGLYPVLNGMGALFVDASEYREGVIDPDMPGFDPELRSIKVNPNYLQQYPVNDAFNSTIEISEETSDWILLVPEIYRNKEKVILTYFQRRRPEGQRLRIIWTAGNQKAFSFDPSIYPEQNNLIADPIIEVVTIKNSVAFDRANVCNGSGGEDPLKVKLVGRDAGQTLEKIKPELVNLKLDENLRRLITIDQYVLEEAYYLQQTLNMLVPVSMILAVGLLLLVVQNIVIFFDKYQRKFVVRRLFGMGFFKSYKEYLFLFLGVWAMQLPITFAVNFLNRNGTAFGHLLILALAVILIEFAASVVALERIEKKNRVKVLKGGV